MNFDYLFNRQIEITGKISPDAVNMVGWIPCGISLGICQLDQKSLTTNPIVVAHSRLSGSSPREVNIFPTIFFNQCSPLLGNVIGDRINISADQLFQNCFFVYH